MANSSVKTIINARSTSFKMTGNRTVSTSFSSSDLGSDYFWLNLAGDAYAHHTYWYVDESRWWVPPNANTCDAVGWPHSNPYTPGNAIKIIVNAPSTKTYSIRVSAHCAFLETGPAYDAYVPNGHSWYRWRIDVDSTKLYDTGWTNNHLAPFKGASSTSISVPSSLKWVDFGPFSLNLSKGEHTIYIKVGACYRKHTNSNYSIGATIAINDVKVTLS